MGHVEMTGHPAQFTYVTAIYPVRCPYKLILIQCKQLLSSL